MTDYQTSEMQTLIAQNIHKDKYRRILELRLLHGMTYEAIAEAVEMSSRQIYRIVHKEESRLFAKLNPSPP